MTGLPWRQQISPDLTVGVDPSGCIVLDTPERRITITHVAAFIDTLGDAGAYTRRQHHLPGAANTQES